MYSSLSFNAGMTFKTTVISAPNKENVVDHGVYLYLHLEVMSMLLGGQTR
jgi:hypothetical protein